MRGRWPGSKNTKQSGTPVSGAHSLKGAFTRKGYDWSSRNTIGAQPECTIRLEKPADSSAREVRRPMLSRWAAYVASRSSAQLGIRCSPLRSEDVEAKLMGQWARDCSRVQLSF